MPEMNGTETLLRLREINPNVPVIITSGYSETEIAMSSVEARPAGFLQKPYRPRSFQRNTAHDTEHGFTTVGVPVPSLTGPPYRAG